MIEWAITTKDNPYSPFTQFDDWFHYDVLAEYNTCSYLARLWQGSTDASEFDQFNSLQLAIGKSKRIKETRKLSPAADAGYGQDSAIFKPADLG